ncbi:hypothetical protein [Peribacillus deserti]|uniref:hypothetical protein n=1 Tax=Peribacillus deserti TaxID=673318 RepID=UPI0015E14AC2|nr:hypothetical protein [Peribacillus deserti]
MRRSNDELLKKARDMDRNVEVESGNERTGDERSRDTKTMDPAGLSGADTQGG